MELHSFHRKFSVAKTHNDAGSVLIASPGAHFEIAWQVLFAHDQRVIASRGHRRIEASKNCSPIVLDLTRLAVHQVFRAHHFAAKSRANRLMSQADAQQRGSVRSFARTQAREVTNQIDADPVSYTHLTLPTILLV